MVLYNIALVDDATFHHASGNRSYPSHRGLRACKDGIWHRRTKQFIFTCNRIIRHNPCKLKKALRWVHHMANHDLACRRGFDLCSNLLRRIAFSKNLDLEGVPFLTPLRPEQSASSRGSSDVLTTSSGTTQEEVGSSGMGTGTGPWQRKLFPLDLTEEPDMAWLLSIADLPEPHNA